METLIKKTSSFFTTLIVAFISDSKVNKRLVNSNEEMENSLKNIKHTKTKICVRAWDEDFSVDRDDDYFSPSKWYGN